jgi:4-hydroxybenzoate polyprenyltransferase
MIKKSINLCSDVVFLFVKYRIHISLIFFFLLTYNNYRVQENLNYFLILSFTLWHFALFLFDRIYDREIDKISQPNEYVKSQHTWILYIIVGISLISSFTIYFLSGFDIKYWLVLLPITFLYPLEIYKGYRIKSILLIKNIYSALLIFCLPLLIQLYLISNGNFNFSEVLHPILSLFIYVMIGEVFWDIRDITADKMHNTQTIPNTFGLKFTKFYVFQI